MRGILRSFLIIFILSSCGEMPDSVSEKPPLFQMVSGDSLGIRFKNSLPESEQMNSIFYEYFYNGAGVAAGDLNNDGLTDLVFTGNMVPNQLYLNKGGLQFKNVTKKSGFTDSPSWTTGVTLTDINADGLLDIYICRSGKLDADQRRNLLFVATGIHNGIPRYKEVARLYGLDDPGYGTQAIFFDYDRDNDLDLFLLNHNVETKPYYDVAAAKAARDPYVGDKLFRNEDQKYIDVSEQAGIIGHQLGYGLGVAAGDLNNDGWADLYVGNDYSEHDYLYLNQRDGTFKEVLKERTGHTSNFSMGVDINDINNDGLQDVVVLDMVAEDNYGIKASMSGMNPELFATHVSNGFHYQYMFNTLQLNRGNGEFSEIGQLAGVSNTDWSWAPLVVDLDNDGLKDLFVTNGLKRDFRNNDYRNFKIKALADAEEKQVADKSGLIKQLVNRTPQKKINNYVFKNQGDLTFSNQTEEWGIATPTFSNGLTYADLDNDGDLDLVSNNVDDFASIYVNQTAIDDKAHFLQVKLEGPKSNPLGVGAKVSLTTGDQTQTIENYLTRGYQSSVWSVLHFGVPDRTTSGKLEVIWSDGSRQELQLSSFDQRISVRYSSFKQESPSEEDLGYEALEVGRAHEENEFDDYAREMLLPHRMSQMGPFVAVGDIDRDGLEDFYVGGASSYSGQLWSQTESGFVEVNGPWKADQSYEDMDAHFFDADGDGDLDLYVVSGGNESPAYSEDYQDRLYLNDNGRFSNATDRLPKINQSGSKVISADIDADGDLDLVIAGRQVPGKYPKSASSYYLENIGGQFEDATQQRAPEFLELGMVTDLVTIDIDGDQDQDLVLVGEWMPVTFFENQEGALVLDKIRTDTLTSGWWNSIEVADLDMDGDQDLVAGNNGLNYKYKASVKEPFQIFADDFDQNGSLDIVLGYYNSGALFPLRGRECSSNQIPDIKKKFPTYNAFAGATLFDVYGQQPLNASFHRNVYSFASAVFENNGTDFIKHDLPSIAQLSTVNGIVLEDINKDKQPDLILAGNLYQSEVETPRNDASKGLFLINEGGFRFSEKDNGFISGDVKDLDRIVIRDEVFILSTRNNGRPQLLKLAE